jgi:2-polyprenyl-3-methyl-5-hydroxy-6-metoxy-1,4-benzoquinol methylase
MRWPSTVERVSEAHKPSQAHRWAVSSAMNAGEEQVIGFASPNSGAPLGQEGEFLVSSDGERVPFVRGIPRFVLYDSYASSFGLEWTIHSQTQLDSSTRTHLSRARLERCLGMPLSELRGKLVLEAGCGAGRFTELMVGAGALVHAIDLSMAVEANRRNIGEQENYVVAQADLLAPPFTRESFDLVLCMGVLQHTPSPERSIQALWSMVKPGGMLVLDHYTWSLSAVTKLAPLYRLFLRKMAPERARAVTDWLVDRFFPLHWAVRRLGPAQMLLSRISPCLVYCHVYPQLTKEQHQDWCRLDTFDHLTDHYKHRRTVGQMRRVLKSLGADHIHVVRDGNGIEGRCRRRRLDCCSQLGENHGPANH